MTATQKGYLLATIGYQYDDEGMSSDDGYQADTVFLSQEAAQIAYQAATLKEIRSLDSSDWESYFWYPAQNGELEEAIDFYNQHLPEYNALPDQEEEEPWEEADKFPGTHVIRQWPDDRIMQWYNLLPFSFYRVETIAII